MKQKNLKRAILLGLAMSVTAYSMGMAEDIKVRLKTERIFLRILMQRQ